MSGLEWTLLVAGPPLYALFLWFFFALMQFCNNDALGLPHTPRFWRWWDRSPRSSHRKGDGRDV